LPEQEVKLVEQVEEFLVQFAHFKNQESSW
jgi:hypothetical protein